MDTQQNKWEAVSDLLDELNQDQIDLLLKVVWIDYATDKIKKDLATDYLNHGIPRVYRSE